MARLTSIVSLTPRHFISLGAQPDGMHTCIVTFKEGKTILATGAYSIQANIPQETWNYISRRNQNEKVFARNIHHYYEKIRPILKARNMEIKSFRRGALQHLASLDDPKYYFCCQDIHR